MLIPLPETVVSEWRIQIRYADGSAAGRVAVHQMWKDSSTESGLIMHSEGQETDSDGFVVFPERRIFTPLLLRGVGAMLSQVDFWSHGSYGRMAEIYVDGYHPNLTYRNDGELPSSLVIFPDEVPKNAFHDLGEPSGTQ